jgi:hypothetical protein
MARTYPAGVPCWVQLRQPDAEAARSFYGELLGWTFDEDGVASVDGAPVAGVVTGEENAWTTYVAVDDVDAAARAVARAGGSVAAPAVCADPAGAAFRLWPSERPGAQLVNAPASWNFSNLHTSDADVAQRFYGSVFGWNAAAFEGGVGMWQLAGYGDHLAATVDPEIHARQANAPTGFADVIAGLAPAAPDEPASWRVVFSVTDRDESVRRASNLWARVIATEETMWTRTARLLDPQGAEVTLSQFTPPDGFGG